MPAAMFPRLKSALRVLSVLGVLTTRATAASPSLGAIRPVSAQPRTEIEVTLSGARLGDAKEVFYYQPGITTVSLARVDDNTVKAKLKIAADAPLGLHDLRVRTASGISELRTFSVGTLKEVPEVEPNNDFAAPQMSSRRSRTTTRPMPRPSPSRWPSTESSTSRVTSISTFLRARRGRRMTFDSSAGRSLAAGLGNVPGQEGRRGRRRQR